VKPLSHDAYIATIRSAMSVARAQGHDRIVLTTGRRSERFAQTVFSDFPDECFVQIGDFFKQSLETAASKGFKRISIAVFFGKALKMAQAFPHTHAGKSTLTLRRLGNWTRQITNDAALGKRIDNANTAREAFFILIDRHPEVIAYTGKRIVAAASEFIGTISRVQSVIFDYDGKVAFDSERMEA
jgi:cobalt-precorrin-5B (C1)-methyltransferase